MYFGKTDKWYPMLELENYSAYDRDSCKMLGDSDNEDAKTVEDVVAIKQQLEATFKKGDINEQTEPVSGYSFGTCTINL